MRMSKNKQPVDAEHAKSKLIEAALKIFSEAGFEGSTIDKIATEAGVNRQLVHYYFGSKRGLFEAVLTTSYDRFVVRQIDLPKDNPKKSLMLLVDHIFDGLRKNQEFIFLLIDENIRRAKNLKEMPEVSRRLSPLINMIEGCVKDGIMSGAFRSDSDPTRVYISIIALCAFVFSNKHTMSLNIGRDLSSETELEKWRDHVKQVIIRSVSAA